nr:MAG TPA: hypothetical protein [Bacteriophage sp.]
MYYINSTSFAIFKSILFVILLSINFLFFYIFIRVLGQISYNDTICTYITYFIFWCHSSCFI